MKLEKSCGAVVYRVENGERQYLIEHMALGHISISKGHVENEETEVETTLREIKEETNLDVIVDTGFRHSITYSPAPEIMKDVVFFVATPVSEELINQECEVSSLEWLSFSDAYEKLTFESDKETLMLADKYIQNL